MLRHIQKFFNVQFKIKECEEDNVFESDSDDEEKVVEVDKKEESVKFPSAFIFSCIGVGLTNLARKIE
jgi:hypothetical protein